MNNELWENLKLPNICVIRIPKRKREEKLKEVIADFLSKFEGNYKPMVLSSVNLQQKKHE